MDMAMAMAMDTDMEVMAPMTRRHPEIHF